jgi:hypothetical protein
MKICNIVNLDKKREIVFEELIEFDQRLTGVIIDDLPRMSKSQIIYFFRSQGTILINKLHCIDIEVQESESDFFIDIWIIANTWQTTEIAEGYIWALRKFVRLINKIFFAYI